MPQFTSHDDRLSERASKGDKEALAAIFERYHQDLYRYCAAILGNPEDARDALQNTMVKLLAALPGERRQVRLKPWLYRVAHNEAIEVLRRRRSADPIEAEALVGEVGVETQAEARERLRHLVGDLRELPDRQRGALLMRELGGLSFDQIGAALETSPSVARQTVYEARLGLQEMESGREMECEEARRRLSDGDRRMLRRRDLRSHLRHCQGCRDFELAIDRRRRDLAAISPLPALAATALLKGLVGGAAASAGSGLGAGAGTIGGTIMGSTAVKTVATIGVVGVIGVSAADRADLVRVFPGEDRGASTSPGPASPGSGEARRAGGNALSDANRADPRGARAAVSGRLPATAGKRDDPGRAPPASSPTPSSASEPSSTRPSQGRSASEGRRKGRGKGAPNAHGGNPKAKGGTGKAHPQGSPPGQAKKGGNGKPPATSPPSEAKPPGQAKSSPSGGEGKDPAQKAEPAPQATSPPETGTIEEQGRGKPAP